MIELITDVAGWIAIGAFLTLTVGLAVDTIINN